MDTSLWTRVKNKWLEQIRCDNGALICERMQLMEVIQSDQSRLSIGSDAKCDSTLMGLHMLTRWEKSYKTVMYLGEAQHGFCELGGRRMNSLRYADDIQNLDRDIYL